MCIRDRFQSLLSPFIVLFTVPLAFTGGLLGLLLTGQQLTMISMMGFIAVSYTHLNTSSSTAAASGTKRFFSAFSRLRP